MSSLIREPARARRNEEGAPQPLFKLILLQQALPSESVYVRLLEGIETVSVVLSKVVFTSFTVVFNIFKVQSSKINIKQGLFFLFFNFL